eukprot:CAMPEP_0194159718 /NCGR_PEP_ID=MMETSP0152-20130528/77993_1 /TAXON_ID=1049557 /ORGANISM="Thalassiothrix antarctica, Strain L6-D1" /LENGTH=465 /DNA_ID=CAMNT_0038869333 /DNA_START=563 /DNA_END=1960 /DNA_ORIENTATION=+
MSSLSSVTRRYMRIGSVAIVFMMLHIFLNTDQSPPSSPRRFLQAKTDEAEDTNTTTSDSISSVESNYVSENNLRMLSFGTSRTWGSGMNHPKTEAYPGLLNSRNEAIRASDSNYPAMCTYSMVGEHDIVDVITIEYMPMSFWGTRDSILQLGRRLRQRFPDATIIFLNVWTPHQFFHKETNTGLRQFVIDNTDMTGKVVLPEGALEEALQKTSNQDWEFYGFNEDWLEDAANDPLINGTVLSLAPPNMEDPMLAILSVAPLYLKDMSHFSKLGHVWTKNLISDFLQEQNKKRSDRVNPWESTDQCLSWFETGQSLVGTNMHMNEFSPTKFGLEAYLSKPLNFLELINENSHPEFLYLSHMSTGPNAFYPDAIAEIYSNMTELELSKSMSFDDARKKTSSKHIFTCYNETPPQLSVHVVSHHYIGEVPPGRSFLTLKPNMKKPYPFRSVGIILSPKAFGDRVEAIF